MRAGTSRRPTDYWRKIPRRNTNTHMLQRLFHVNICVREMERSIRFYQDLGFNKVSDFTLDDPNVGEALGLKAKKIRGAFMRLGDDKNAPVLDLVQFIDPPP